MLPRPRTPRSGTHAKLLGVVAGSLCLGALAVLATLGRAGVVGADDRQPAPEAAPEADPEADPEQVHADVARVLVDLASPDRKVRGHAADTLDRLGAAACAPLAEALASPRRGVRLVAIEALDLLDEDAAGACPALAARLAGEPDADLRRLAAALLERIAARCPTREIRSVEAALRPVLQADDDARVRGHAAAALGQVAASGPSLLALADALVDDAAAVRLASAHALADAWLRRTTGSGPGAPSVDAATESDDPEALAAIHPDLAPFDPVYDPLPGDGRSEAPLVTLRDAVVDALGDALAGDPSSEVRAAAANALGVVGRRGAAEALVEAAGDGDPAVRIAVAHALAAFGRAGDAAASRNASGDGAREQVEAARIAATALPALLADRRSEVTLAAIAAAYALGGAADGSIERLAALVDGGDSALREPALGAMFAIRGGAEGAARSSARRGPAADPATERRTAEARAVGDAAILRALAHPHPGLAQAACRGLAAERVAPPVAVALLAGLLDDPAVSHDAAWALGWAGGPGAEVLARTLVEGSEQAARAAARGLSSIDERCASAAPLLAVALRTARPEHRPAAAEALVRLGPKAASAAPDLVAVARADDKEARAAALEALVAIGPDGESALRTLFATSEVERRREVAAALGSVPPPLLLADLLLDADAEVQAAARAALAGERGAYLACDIWRLDDRWAPRLRAIIGARGQIAGALPLRAGAEVGVLVGTPDPELRRDAWRAAAALAPQAITAALPHAVRWLAEGQVEDRNGALDLLAAAGVRAWPALGVIARALGADPDPEVRAKAAAALGSIGPAAREAKAALGVALDDLEPAVRVAAARALASVRSVDADGLRALVERASDPVWSVRLAALDALAALGRAPRGGFAAGDVEVARLAALLCEQGPVARGVGPELTRVLEADAWWHPDPASLEAEVRAAACRALAALLARESEAALSPAARAGAVDSLVSALDDVDLAVRLRAAAALPADAHRAVPRLEHLLRSDRWWRLDPAITEGTAPGTVAAALGRLGLSGLDGLAAIAADPFAPSGHRLAAAWQITQADGGAERLASLARGSPSIGRLVVQTSQALDHVTLPDDEDAALAVLAVDEVLCGAGPTWQTALEAVLDLRHGPETLARALLAPSGPGEQPDRRWSAVSVTAHVLGHRLVDIAFESRDLPTRIAALHGIPRAFEMSPATMDRALDRLLGGDLDRDEAYALAHAVARHGHQVSGPLARTLADASLPARRRALAVALIGLGVPSTYGATPALVEAAADPARPVRVASLAALGRLGWASRLSRAEVARLTARVAAIDDVATGRALVLALGTLPIDPALPAERFACWLGDRHAGDSAATVLRGLGEHAEGVLIEALGSDSPTARVNAATALGARGPTRSREVPAALERVVVGDFEPAVRVAAAWALAGACGPNRTRATAALAQALADDPDQGVRSTAVYALAQLRPGRQSAGGRALVDAATHDPDAEVSAAAAREATGLYGTAARPAAIRFVESWLRGREGPGPLRRLGLVGRGVLLASAAEEWRTYSAARALGLGPRGLLALAERSPPSLRLTLASEALWEAKRHPRGHSGHLAAAVRLGLSLRPSGASELLGSAFARAGKWQAAQRQAIAVAAAEPVLALVRLGIDGGPAVRALAVIEPACGDDVEQIALVQALAVADAPSAVQGLFAAPSRGPVARGIARALATRYDGIDEVTGLALIGALDAADALPRLERALEHSDATVRDLAVAALASLEAKAAPALPALARLLSTTTDDVHDEVQGDRATALADAIEAIGPGSPAVEGPLRRRAAAELAKPARRRRPVFAASLLVAAGRPSEAAGVLAAVLADPRQAHRAYAALELLRRLGPAGRPAASHAAAFLGHDNSTMAVLAAQALSAIGDPALVPALRRHLAIQRYDGATSAIAAAIQELGAADPETVGALAGALFGAAGGECVVALAALGPAAAPAIPDLVALLGAGSPTAAHALAAIGPAARVALPELELALRSSRPDVAWAAGRALGALGPPSVASLLDARVHLDPGVRRAAARGLAELAWQRRQLPAGGWWAR